MPQHYNVGTPGVEAGDLKAIIDQMGQMMAMLADRLAAVEGTTKPTGETAKAASSKGDDPLHRSDAWQAARPAMGPPGMLIPEPEARSGPDLGPKPLDKKNVEKPN